MSLEIKEKDGIKYIPWIREKDKKKILKYVKPEVLERYLEKPTVIVELPDAAPDKFEGITHFEWPAMGFSTIPYDHRYSDHDMRVIFSEANRLQLILDGESGLASGHAKYGTVNKKHAEEIIAAATVKLVRPEEVAARESLVTRHDQVAVNKTHARFVSPEAAQEIHKAATSNDKLDNADPFRIYQAMMCIREKAIGWLEAAYYKMDVMEGIVGAGRTHKQIGVPVTHLFKFANHTSDLMKDIKRLDIAISNIELKGFKGAMGSSNALVSLFKNKKYLKNFLEVEGDNVETLVGTSEYKRILEDKEKVNIVANYAAGLLEKEAVDKFKSTATTEYLREGAQNIKTAKITKQVVSREYLVDAYDAVKQLVTTAEQFANEITDLQRTEIWEWIEGFDPKQQYASSAMPGKKNPVKSENVKGQARLIRSFAGTITENRIFAHERDLPNTAYERTAISTIFLAADEAIKRTIWITEKLYINKDRIKENAEKYAHLLCGEALIYELEKRGIGRHDAHKTIRDASIVLMDEGTKDIDPVSVFDRYIKRDYGEGKISEEELKETLNPENYIGLAEQTGLEIRDDMKNMLEKNKVLI